MTELQDGDLLLRPMRLPADVALSLCQDSLPIVIGDPAYRSRGLGRRVTRLLIGRGKALGWTHLQVKMVYTYNVRSQRLFEGLGFLRSGEGADEHGRTYYRYHLPL